MPIFRQYWRTLWINTTLLDNDAIPTDPRLDKVVVLSSYEVVIALNTNEHEPSYDDEDEVGHKEDDIALIE